MSFDFQAAYAELNLAEHDYLFYASLAHQVGANRALDLGCGTGTLARGLASRGLTVVGIDPDPHMLAFAADAPHGDLVDWRLGYSDVATPQAADIAIMSGHVAQVFLDDAQWARTLADLHRAVVSGGTLAFESRHPGARQWEEWTRDETLRTLDTTDGRVEFWHETAWVTLPLVGYDTYTRNLRTGEETCDRDVLSFRSAQEIIESVTNAGFSVSPVLGDWNGAPLRSDSPEIIVIAKKLNCP